MSEWFETTVAVIAACFLGLASVLVLVVMSPWFWLAVIAYILATNL